MTFEELQDLLANVRQVGVDLSHVEVKRAEGGLPKRLWETLSAFANTPGGGVILLGLDEESGFQVTGVPNPARQQSDLASLCDQMEPPLRPLIQVYTLEGRHILAAEIPEVAIAYKPCHYRGAGLMTGSFIRVADGDRHLTQYEIQVFLDNRGQPTYDLEPVSGKSPDDLDPGLLEVFLARLRSYPDAPYRAWERQRLLQAFRVLVDHEGRLTPSLAGYLCFGIYPQDVFPNLHLTVVRYPTTRPGESSARGERLLDNVKAEGPLIAMLRQGMSAITRNLQRRAVVQGLFRQDVWEYPLETLREALVNALAHRDYSPLARGTPVQVRIFPDRLEVENPGGLFGPVTLERLGEAGLLATRNTYLMRLLEDLPTEDGRVVCENRGTGITTMLESLRAAGMEPPRFADRHTTFRLTFANASLLDDDTLAWLQRFAGHPLNDAQRLALAYVRREERLTHAEYRRLNPGLDSAEVTRQLADLVQQGVLRQHGARRWTFYTLPGETKPEDVTNLEGKEQVVLDYVRAHGAITRNECATLLKVKPHQATYLLQTLRERGVLHQQGSRRWTRYVLDARYL
ncbi:MAG: putative DNA binding domain-containing protein [Anaerolineae bacterium]|nr:putative DNA binding domain-containing protein [Anaerolineae bacterium]